MKNIQINVQCGSRWLTGGTWQGEGADSASWFCPCAAGLWAILYSPSACFSRRPAFPASQGTHGGQGSRVWQCESSLLAVLKLGQWKTQWVDYLYEGWRSPPTWGITASFSIIFNDHKLWDRAHNGWHWPKETRRGGLIKWGIRHCWLSTQWPPPSLHVVLSACGQSPIVEVNIQVHIFLVCFASRMWACYLILVKRDLRKDLQGTGDGCGQGFLLTHRKTSMLLFVVSAYDTWHSYS